MKIAVVVNPKHQKKVNRLAAALRPHADVSLVLADGIPAIPSAMDKVLAMEPDVVIPGGGDGTVLETLNACDAAAFCWLFAPLGGSNDLARAIGHGTQADVVEVVQQGRVQAIDRCSAQVTTAEGTRAYTWVSSAGVGFVPSLFELESRWWGTALLTVLRDGAYPLLALYNAVKYRGVSATVTADGQVHEGTSSMLEIAKVGDTGGLHLTPSGQLTGGWFDVCWVDKISVLAQAGALVDVLRQRHVQRADTAWFTDDAAPNRYGQARVAEVIVTTDPVQAVHLHGEIVGQTPASFLVHNNGLQVWTR